MTYARHPDAERATSSKSKPSPSTLPSIPAKADTAGVIGHAESTEQALHAAVGRFTGGLSPSALLTAYCDWSLHLAGSPAKQAELWLEAAETQRKILTGLLFATLGANDPERIEPDPSDRRFSGDAWRAWPYNFFSQSFLRHQAWWSAATRGVRGVERRHEEVVAFMARQALDMVAPTNFAATNPVVQDRTREEMGRNLVRGVENYFEDLAHLIAPEPRDHPEYRVGETVAVTPGSVVYRNSLIELIHYPPTTETTRPEPLLIVPAWIMKYYILDLTPERSLVRYLRDQGYQVFIISWKNPGAEDAQLGMEDYLELGVNAAIEAIQNRTAAPAIHAAGYCLGGTLLSIAAAADAQKTTSRLKSMSLLAAQVDFSEAGELSLFINESQLAFLDDIMATQGFLRAEQMTGTFTLLRSNDLIWSRVVRHYLLGERSPMNAIMAWNEDATRMPFKMHSQYLRELFLENRLATGRYAVEGKPVALSDICCPIFCLGADSDHVSPWRSVYKIGLLTDTDVTFALTNGGHNGGILSEPGRKGRRFRIAKKTEGDIYSDADAWLTMAEPREGSWWEAWVGWLNEHSAQPEPLNSPSSSEAEVAAPGTYVFG